jgi:hypothetical protein
MKSCHEASQSDRRAAFVLRSSSVLGVVLSLIAVGIVLGGHAVREAPAVDPDVSIAVATPATSGAPSIASERRDPRSSDDLVEFPPHWIQAPGF